MSRSLLLVLAAATLVSACGVTGGLERPRPMWNRAEAEAAEARREAAECRHQRRQCPASPASTTGASPNEPGRTSTSPAPQ